MSDLCATVGCNHRRDEHLRIGTRAGSCQVAGHRLDAVHPDDADDCVEFTEPPTVAEPTADVRRCIHCGERQRTEESLQRDFDGVLDERIGLQVAMQQAIDVLDSPDPKVRNRVRLILSDALDVLVPVVENHPKPKEA